MITTYNNTLTRMLRDPDCLGWCTICMAYVYKRQVCHPIDVFLEGVDDE